MLVRFEPSSSTAQPKYINPQLVRALMFDDTTNYTIVEFDAQHRVNIALPIEQVAGVLNINMTNDDEVGASIA
jgi:hypothetical protein